MLSPATRKVVHRSPTHSVWRLSLPYLQSEAVEAESTLERDFVHLAALFYATTSIKHQPFHLTTASGGYTPDFLVCFTDGSRCVVEVKPEALLAGHEEKLAQASEVLAQHGLHFVVALDRHIHESGRHENAILIRRYGKSRLDVLRQGRFATELAKGPQSVGELKALGFTIADIAQNVCRHKVILGPNLGLDDQQIVNVVESSPAAAKGDSHAVCFKRWLTDTTG